ncbi:MAG: hypothetical protein MUF84_19105 [Anaerolineae bacterium]|jgi:uncharacterized membrane protein|nr:hypothetical protein [Anaerolineae bacterium]
MSSIPPLSEVSVDRREETVITQQPGYAATAQVTRDVAAERRLRMALIIQVVWGILGFLEVVLGLRFLLKLIAANPNSGFAVLVYSFSGLFLAPFAGLVGNPRFGGAVLEVTTVIGMMVYVLLFWGAAGVVNLAAHRPVARTVARSTHEQLPGSTLEERTTPTVERN